ncbi:MAG: hypothetical protein PHN69_03170 [Candidatus Pacebacteria bacterium]|nr:hypothetical protein [Candidatus Paceibacterota bacterium]
MIFQPLYKLASTGKIQVWQVKVEGNVITREYGQLGGKITTQCEVIETGKNIGRSNETTPEAQALAEATSDYNSKLEKDYFLSIDEASNQESKSSKQGGYLPMLAQDYRKHADRHLRFPCVIQPKLDGIRAIAIKNDNVTKLYTRSGKTINTLPTVVYKLNHIMNNGDIFDGELYLHKEDFNEFTGSIRASVNLDSETTDRMEYHMYDVPRINGITEETPFIARYNILKELPFTDCLKLVETHIVNSFEEALVWYDKWVEDGYEGMMFRNIDMPYEQKRSYNLLKYKDMVDEEFEVVDVIIETRGNMKHYMIECITRNGIKFTAKMKGTQEGLSKLFSSPRDIIGKMATVQYFGYTPKGSLRFPIGKTIRFDL